MRVWKTDNIAKYVVLAIMGGGFYCINKGEPLRCDDLIYQFFWQNVRDPSIIEPIDLNNQVDSYLESFESQCNHYLVMNGRFIIHFIVQCFCGFLGRPLFNVVNTVIYVLFLDGCLRFINIVNGQKSVAALSLIWLGLPIVYIFWYSIAFAVNYLWTSTALLSFFLLFRKYSTRSTKESNGSLLMLFLVGLVVGSLHEGFSLPLSGALLLYLLFYRDRINRYLLIMSIGVWIGTMAVVFSPGIIGRGSRSLNGMSVGDLVMMKLDVLRYSKRFFVLFILIAFFVVRNRQMIFNYLSGRMMEFLFIVLSFLMVLAMPHYSQRMEFPLELLSLLFVIEISLNGRFWQRHEFISSSVLCLLMVIHSLITIYYAQLTKKEYNEMLSEYHFSNEGKTHFRDYSIPKLVNPYIHRLGDEAEWDYISFVNRKKINITK